MAARKKDWSLTDRLLQGSRDSVDRQGRFPLRHHATPPRTANPMAASARGFSTPILHGGYPSSSPRTANPAALASVRGPNSRQGQPPLSKPAVGASPDRLRERSEGSGVPHTGGSEGYRRDTYSKPDLASLESGKLVAHRARETRHVATPEGRGGWGYDAGHQELEHTVPKREAYRPSTRSGEGTRAASTEAAFRSADTSMFDSTVTPKAAPLKDYKPRGKTVKDKNIQAFY